MGKKANQTITSNARQDYAAPIIRPDDGCIERVQRIGLPLFLLLLTAFVLFEGSRGKTFGSKILSEGDLWNYVSSLVYFIAGEMAVLNAILVGRRWRRANPGQWTLAWLPWAMVGAAFTFSAFDEMLEIHEKLRHAVEQAIPFLNHAYPGHGSRFMLVAYLACSLVFAVVVLWRSLSGRLSKLYLAAGFLLVGLAVACDSLPHLPWFGVGAWAVIEELSELYAGAAFVASFASSAVSMWISQRHSDKPAFVRPRTVSVKGA